MAKKYFYKVLTVVEQDDKDLFSPRFVEINAMLRPELEPYFCSKQKKWIWKLTKDWEVEYRGTVYIVPKGFSTDGASIPRFLWPLFGTPMEVPRLYVALLHDYLYTIGPKVDPDPKCVLRAQADLIYRDFNIQLGCPKVRTNVEYWFIRKCGDKHWVVEDE